MEKLNVWFYEADFSINKRLISISLGNIGPDNPIIYSLFIYLIGENMYGIRSYDDFDIWMMVTYLAEYMRLLILMPIKILFW